MFLFGGDFMKKIKYTAILFALAIFCSASRIHCMLTTNSPQSFMTRLFNYFQPMFSTSSSRLNTGNVEFVGNKPFLTTRKAQFSTSIPTEKASPTEKVSLFGRLKTLFGPKKNEDVALQLKAIYLIGGEEVLNKFLAGEPEDKRKLLIKESGIFEKIADAKAFMSDVLSRALSDKDFTKKTSGVDMLIFQKIWGDGPLGNLVKKTLVDKEKDAAHLAIKNLVSNAEKLNKWVKPLDMRSVNSVAKDLYLASGLEGLKKFLSGLPKEIAAHIEKYGVVSAITPARDLALNLLRGKISDENFIKKMSHDAATGFIDPEILKRILGNTPLKNEIIEVLNPDSKAPEILESLNIIANLMSKKDLLKKYNLIDAESFGDATSLLPLRDFFNGEQVSPEKLSHYKNVLKKVLGNAPLKNLVYLHASTETKTEKQAYGLIKNLILNRKEFAKLGIHVDVESLNINTEDLPILASTIASADLLFFKELLAAGVNPNQSRSSLIRDPMNDTVFADLLIRDIKKFKPYIEAAIEHGADINVVNNGNTVLATVIESADVDMLKNIIKRYHYINWEYSTPTQGTYLDRALRIPDQEKRKEIATLLIDQGVTKVNDTSVQVPQDVKQLIKEKEETYKVAQENNPGDYQKMKSGRLQMIFDSRKQKTTQDKENFLKQATKDMQNAKKYGLSYNLDHPSTILFHENYYQHKWHIDHPQKINVSQQMEELKKEEAEKGYVKQ